MKYHPIVLASLVVIGCPLLTYAATKPAAPALPRGGCSAQAGASPRLAGCIQCTYDSCTIDPDQTLVASGSPTDRMRCVDYDHDGKGHCVKVSGQEYIIKNYYYPYEDQGYCVREDCAHGTVPSNPVACARPA